MDDRMERQRQNESITRQTNAIRAREHSQAQEIERELRRSARENAKYEKLAAGLSISLDAMQHIVNRHGWTRATEVTGLSEEQLRIALQCLKAKGVK